MTELLREPAFWTALILFCSTVLVGSWNVRKSFSVSDKISAAAVALIEPLEKRINTLESDLQTKENKIKELERREQQQADKITNLTNRLYVIEKEHVREIKRHTDEIVKLKQELEAVKRENDELSIKYQKLYEDYEAEREARIKEEKTNHRLSERVTALRNRVRELEIRLGTKPLRDENDKVN